MASGFDYRELAEIRERLARLEERVNMIAEDIQELKRLVLRRNSYLKWTTIIIGMILSFIATLFGLGWYPP